MRRPPHEACHRHRTFRDGWQLPGTCGFMRTYCTCVSLRSDMSKHIAINGLRGVRAWGVVPKPGDARV